MKSIHQRIHLTRATGLLLVLGTDLDTEFKVLNMHRDNVTSSPRRPGICSVGIRKLIWKSENMYYVQDSASYEKISF